MPWQQRPQREDPEKSRREAEQALVMLQNSPDADLEVRARLVLCDHHAERSQQDAETQLAAIEALLPRIHRHGLRAAIWKACRGITPRPWPACAGSRQSRCRTWDGSQSGSVTGRVPASPSSPRSR